MRYLHTVRFCTHYEAYTMRLFRVAILFLVLSTPVFSNVVFGQNRHVIDSLMKNLPTSSDTTLARLYNAIAWEYRWFDLDSALKYVRLGEDLSRQLNFRDGLAQNQNFAGVIYFNRGDLSKAMDFFLNALQLSEQPPRNVVELGYALNNIGNVYKQQGAMKQAVEYMMRALQEFESLGDKRGIAYCCIRLAESYRAQKTMMLLLCMPTAHSNCAKRWAIKTAFRAFGFS